MNASAASGKMPDLRGSAPVLISTSSIGARPSFSASLASAPQRLGRSNGMDDIEQSNCVADLIRLQRADEVEFEAGMPLAQGRPFGIGLLDPIFAERDLARGNDRRDGVGVETLRHRHQGDVAGIAARVPARSDDLVPHAGEGGNRILRQRDHVGFQSETDE